MEKLPFDYTIISHPRRKRIAISVTPEGKVIIRTPPRTARKRIEKMLEENAGWVMESLSRVQAGDRKKWRWEPGGVMPLLGQEMTVALAADGKPGIYDGKIALTGNCPEDWVRCGKALYRQIAGEYMQKLVSELEPLVGVRAAGVNIGNARRSWGAAGRMGSSGSAGGWSGCSRSSAGMSRCTNFAICCTLTTRRHSGKRSRG